MKKLAVLISDTGKGTNLQAIIDEVNSKKLQAEIVAVISDSEKAEGIGKAKTYRIPTAINKKKETLLQLLKSLNSDYIVLSGWKQFINEDVISTFPNQILNLHPGLIPDTIYGVYKNPDNTDGLWNKGKLTDVAIKNVLNSNATYAGSSIHFLTHEFDFGPVLGRTFEKVREKDSVESLYKRLKKKENQLYVAVLTKLCNE